MFGDKNVSRDTRENFHQISLNITLIYCIMDIHVSVEKP